jgi:hypothetical protein
MPKRKDPEERYKEHIRHEQKTLEEYAAHETEYAEDLLSWYKIKNRDMPDGEYRAAAFFKNREYLMKPGSLTLLYSVYRRISRELPPATRETAFNLLAYRYHAYAVTLEKGGFS